MFHSDVSGDVHNGVNTYQFICINTVHRSSTKITRNLHAEKYYYLMSFTII